MGILVDTYKVWVIKLVSAGLNQCIKLVVWFTMDRDTFKSLSMLNQTPGFMHWFSPADLGLKQDKLWREG